MIARITLFLLLLAALATAPAGAQSDPLAAAHALVVAKKWDSAAVLLQPLYAQNPGDAEVYSEFLEVQIARKAFKEARKLVEEQGKIRGEHPLLHVDAGAVLAAEGKSKRASEEWDIAITQLNGDDMLSQQVASAFQRLGQDEFVIRTWERTREMTRNPYLHATELARLYAKAGDMDRSVTVLLDAVSGMPNGGEESKALLLEILGADAKKLQAAQKALLKRINAQPDNPYYPDLLTWLYTQKGDWEGALQQIVALDARERGSGQRLLDFAHLARREKQWDVSLQALAAIREKGPESPLYALAFAEGLTTGLTRLDNNPDFTPADVAALEKDFRQFVKDYPQYYSTAAILDYARLEARYAGKPDTAIALLTKSLDQPAISRQTAGAAKLQLGDYLVLTGRVWDATLYYSQVDKSFREDALGEDARFRNARLAYYRGDFEWAQGQLSVLKASTSELIANDALYLSVLITENVPADSNLVPLRRFAYADLLLFQNKDKEAEALLDSLSGAYPKHPLKDDILMLRATLAEKHREYPSALAFLEQIHKEHGTDVLGDDAVYRIAKLYDEKLKSSSDAKKWYEQLIIEYPGSSWLHNARTRLAELNAPAS